MAVVASVTEVRAPRVVSGKLRVPLWVSQHRIVRSLDLGSDRRQRSPAWGLCVQCTVYCKRTVYDTVQRRARHRVVHRNGSQYIVSVITRVITAKRLLIIRSDADQEAQHHCRPHHPRLHLQRGIGCTGCIEQRECAEPAASSRGDLVDGGERNARLCPACVGVCRVRSTGRDGTGAARGGARQHGHR